MNDNELNDPLTYNNLMLKVVHRARELYHSLDKSYFERGHICGEALQQAITIAIAECINNDDAMWAIIHSNCGDVNRAFYVGSIDYDGNSPYEEFFRGCRNMLTRNLEFVLKVFSV